MATTVTVPKISPFGTDEVLWYNPPGTIWGELGYAVPNFGTNPLTLNNNIAELVAMMGANLFAIMHHSDADSRTPPTINTLQRIHKLVVRARAILSARALAPATPRMEPTHATPSPEPFLLFPCPFFKARNLHLRSWAQLILNALGEAMQHTENRIEYEISTAFAGTIGQYLQRIYVRMATEMFQIPLAEALNPAFTLTDAQIAAYDPTKWFTSTELVDTVPSFRVVPTEDDLSVLRAGIPANLIVGLSRYPRGELLDPNVTTNPTIGAQGEIGAAATAAASAPSAPSTGSFVPPPGP